MSTTNNNNNNNNTEDTSAINYINKNTIKNLKIKKRKTNRKKLLKKKPKNDIIHVPMKSNVSSLPPLPQAENAKRKTRQPLEKSELVKLFLEMLTTIKLYHWKTHSYSQHKATDELHEKMSDLVDEFVEVMQGKMFSPNRIRTIDENIKAYTPETKTKMVDKILYYIEQLQNLNNMFTTNKDSDLLNIRDEMLAHLNQFLYLFSFDEI